jgi:hypothetical protein
MRRVIAILIVCALAGVAYPASGIRAAWQIRAALEAGDSALLAQRVDWASLRASLKRSQNETKQVFKEYSEAAGLPAPGLWQRIKSAALPFFSDTIIDRYVTPEGAVQIWSWRQTWRDKVRPALLAEPAGPLAGTWLAGTSVDRGLALLRRIERVAFTSPRRLEVVLLDRYAGNRRWRAAMELRGLTWMLTDIEVSSRRGGDAALGAVAR